MSSSKTMKIFQAVRSVSILSSVAGIVLFAVALNIQTLALQGKQSNLAWGYLPLVGLGYSVFWNFLSLTCLCIGSQYYFPRRFHLLADISAAIALLVMGYLSFVYNAVTFYATKQETPQVWWMEVAGVILLSLSCISHFVCFCHGCKSAKVQSEADALARCIENAPPAYRSRSEYSPSTHSLPEYEGGVWEDVELQKKEINIIEREIRGGSA